MTPRTIAISELRPCDNCAGNLRKPFVIITVQTAILKPDAINEQLGMAQMMGGGQLGHRIAEVMGARGDDVVAIMPKDDTNEVWICHDCFYSPVGTWISVQLPLNLPSVLERRAHRLETDESERSARSVEAGDVVERDSGT